MTKSFRQMLEVNLQNVTELREEARAQFQTATGRARIEAEERLNFLQSKVANLEAMLKQN